MNSWQRNSREQVSLGNLGVLLALGVAILAVLAACFCSRFTLLMWSAFAFNALWLGSRLFSTMAREREKRTIDALRLTQFSSLEILLHKARPDLKSWFYGNSFFAVAFTGAALLGLESVVWAVAVTLTFAASGLLAIASALLVSTLNDRSSSAVLNGWLTKVVWILVLPLLDKVLDAVFVTTSRTNLFAVLDPGWLALHFSKAAYFDLGGWPFAEALFGSLSMLAVAAACLVLSVKTIDSSFEQLGRLTDRNRHPVYRAKFVGGLEKNPFFIRELALQLRSGAGRWPGYAVFLVLFLAPYFYGVAQQEKRMQKELPQTVRAELFAEKQTMQTIPVTVSSGEQLGKSCQSDHRHTCRQESSQPRVCGTRSHRSECVKSGPSVEDSSSYVTARSSVEATPKIRHSHLFCGSRIIGLPVDGKAPTHLSWVPLTPGSLKGRVVPTAHQGQGTDLRPSEDRVKSKAKPATGLQAPLTQRDLGRGLFAGLFLTLVYLFLRGSAFSSGAVAGEKERRAWDQIALTGVEPTTFLNGKLLAVMAYPVRQLLLVSPVLLLFVAVGVMNLLEFALVLALLLTTFTAAATLGLAASAVSKSAHEAQGLAIGIAFLLLFGPLLPGFGWMVVLLLGVLFVARSQLQIVGLLLVPVLAGLGATIGSCYLVSPLFAVGVLSNPQLIRDLVMDYSVLNFIQQSGAGTVSLLIALVWMAMFATAFYQWALRSLEQGGSVRTDG